MADVGSKIPAKSILKQSVRDRPTVTDEQKAKAEKDKKNLNLALQHAHRIQHQKDTEAQILTSITALLDFPTSSPFSTRDAVNFVTLAKAFQPSDLASLVEERCIDEKCGYPLCSNRPRSLTMGASAAWKLKKGMADFCSTACTKKAMYVKAQLSEVPAWERTPEEQVSIQLHEDDRPPELETAVRRANRTARIDEWRDRVTDNDELAMERGEMATSFKPNQVMAETIVEKKPKSYQAPMSMSDELLLGSHGSIEGHEPRWRVKGKPKDEPKDDDGNDDEDE